MIQVLDSAGSTLVEWGRQQQQHGKLCFIEKERGKVWKDYVDWIMNKENDWDYNVEGDAVESQVMVGICQKVLDGFGMPAEWALSIVVP